MYYIRLCAFSSQSLCHFYVSVESVFFLGSSQSKTIVGIRTLFVMLFNHLVL